MPEETQPPAKIPKTSDKFNHTIEYIRRQQKTWNIDADARTWLIKTTEKMISQLTTELQKLQQNKDTPLNIPGYALDPTKPLIFHSDNIPSALLPYKGHFISFLESVFRTHGLNVRCEWVEYYSGVDRISASIKFPEHFCLEGLMLESSAGFMLHPVHMQLMELLSLG